MTIRWHNAAPLLLAAGLHLIACSQSTAPTYSSNAPEAPLAGTAVFPHKATWSSPEEHGAAVRKNGVTDTAVCAGSCHGEQLQGAAGPACTSCHAQYPHAEGWRLPEQHGAAVQASGKTGCTTKCHGTDLQGGLAGVGCTQCHAVYPHATGFAQPAQHGAQAIGANKDLCRSCHGSDLTGGGSQVSCFGCHAEFPHPTGWAQKAQHGATVVANGSTKCATACHGSGLEGGLSQVSCDGCHQLWPQAHRAGEWKTGQHGERYLSLGAPACLGCHGADGAGGSSGVSCVSCHPALLPHSGSAWKTTGHGAYLLSQSGGSEECRLCHGAALDGGKNHGLGVPTASACTTCHASYPVLHTPEWKGSFAGHGQYVVTTLQGKKEDCQLCHGADLQGGSVGKTCSNGACHATYPHQPLWGQDHGAFFVANEQTKSPSSCATANCHGTTLEGNPANATPTDKVVPGCSDCHLAFPHPKEWKHGKADPTFEKCQACHGTSLTGAGKAPSCYECHQSYPDRHWLPGEAWKTPGNAEFHGIYVGQNGMDTCKVCHGAALASCTSCHAAYPHPASLTTPTGVLTFPNWVAGGDHGKYLQAVATLKQQNAGLLIGELCTDCHGSGVENECRACHHQQTADWKASAHGVAAADDATGCRVCHGADLLSGSVIAAGCGGCHGPGQSPHAATLIDIPCEYEDQWCGEDLSVPFTDSLAHGPAAKQSFATCRLCHGNDLRGGMAQKSCFDCHAKYPKYANVPQLTHQTAPSLWKTIAQHGSVASPMKGNGPGPCASCHGTDVQGGLVGPAVACQSCHPQYPHGDMGEWFWGHGQRVLVPNDPATPDDDTFNRTVFIKQCAGCHGEAVVFTAAENTAEFTPNGNYRCYMCHEQYPHVGFKKDATSKDLRWADGHGIFFYKNAAFVGDPIATQIQTVKGFSQGCYGIDTGCHSTARRGPPLSLSNEVCNAACHTADPK